MVELRMSENQAKIVAKACEFYARVRMGQFKEITWLTLSGEWSKEDACERRDAADEALLRARGFLYPDLHGWGHSYGMGKFEDADTAYDVYMVLRQLFGDPRTPFSLSKEPLPTAEQKPNGGNK